MNNLPGAASINSAHDNCLPDGNPTDRLQNSASPVFYSDMPQELCRPKKHYIFSKLCEMDDSLDRREWLDKLLKFMEERGTPISVCPTISKSPIDLFRLYLFVKELGGFLEVTRNKVWVDITGLLNIGASSSATYTLRKHYEKNLLPFECHFDRGGNNPQLIINQVEVYPNYPTHTSPIGRALTLASPLSKKSHVLQDTYEPTKNYIFSKLYEMDASPDRRTWLDKLLKFMAERGTPISVCPTISKSPIDLFRLYLFVKELGGFIEVTKNKVWKDIAGLLNIGASSSAAYTLHKHYEKNLLPFECYFDCDGTDPYPMINQVEVS